MNKKLLLALFIVLLMAPPVFAAEYTFQETFAYDGNIDDYNYMTFDTVSQFIKLPYTHSFSEISVGASRTWYGGIDYNDNYLAVYDLGNDDVNVLRLSDGASVFYKDMDAVFPNLNECAVALDDENVWLICDRTALNDTKLVAYAYLTGGGQTADLTMPSGQFDYEAVMVNDEFVIAMDRRGQARAYNKDGLDLNKAFDFNSTEINSFDDFAAHIDQNYAYFFIRSYAAPTDFNYTGTIFSLPHFTQVADVNEVFANVWGGATQSENIDSTSDYAFYFYFEQRGGQEGVGILDKSTLSFIDINGYYPPTPQFDDLKQGAVRGTRMFSGELYSAAGRYFGDFNITDVNHIFFDSLPIEPTPMQAASGPLAFMSSDFNYYLLTGTGGGEQYRLFKATDFIGIYTQEAQTISSLDINQTSNCLGAAQIDADENVPAGTSIQYYLSNDGGASWTPVSNHSKHTFSSCGKALRWRAVLDTATSIVSPRIFDLNVWHEDGNFSANFTHSPDPPTILDPENGTVNSTVDFNDASYYGDGNTWQASTWWINGTIVSHDQNMQYDFSHAGDYNIFAITQNTGDVNDSVSKTLTIKRYPQDVNFTWSPFNPLVGASTMFYGTCDEDANIDKYYWYFQTGYDANTDQNINHTFTTSGTQQVCLTVHDGVEDLNKKKCHSVPVSVSFRIQFWDENTLATLQPTVFIDGVNYSSQVDGSGVLDLNLQQGLRTVIAHDGTHSQRTWEINVLSAVDLNLLLLPSYLGKNILFTFYGPDETTALSNAWITVKHSPFNRIAGLLQANASGQATFFLNPIDANYTFSIAAADGNYDYNAVHTELKIPLDEKTLAAITPYALARGGVGTGDYNNMNVDINVFMLSNTHKYYTYTFSDVNSIYYPRNYSAKVRGDVNTYSLQPYLIKASDGMPTLIYVVNNLNQKPINQILINAKKDITGQGIAIVESIETDDSGSALFIFIPNDEYWLDFYDINGNLLYENVYLRPIDPEYTVGLDFGGISDVNVGFEQVNLSFIPDKGVLDENSAGDFNWSEVITITGGTITSITISATDNNKLIYLQTYSTGYASGGTLYHSLNDSVLGASLTPTILVKAVVSTQDGNYVFYHLYLIKRVGGYGYPDITQDLRNLKEEELGDFGALLIIIVIELMVLGFAALRTPIGTNASGLFGLFSAVLFLFVAVGWLDILGEGSGFVLWALITLIGVFGMIISRGQGY